MRHEREGKRRRRPGHDTVESTELTMNGQGENKSPKHIDGAALMEIVLYR